jgi:hypothetical protein
MIHSQFWRLRDDDSAARLATWVDDEMDLEHVVCVADKGHQRAGKRLTPLSIELRYGKVNDFVWTWYGECLLQDRVVELLKRECFTGFDVKPVSARFKGRSEQVPTLWEFAVTGWAGLAKPESGVRRTEYCEKCQHARYSDFENPAFLIDETKWDGSDFFMVWPLPGFIFTTDRVAIFLRKHGFTGMKLMRVEELRKPEGVIDGLTPGRLSYWMPHQRAMKLGTNAGIEEI